MCFSFKCTISCGYYFYPYLCYIRTTELTAAFVRALFRTKKEPVLPPVLFIEQKKAETGTCLNRDITYNEQLDLCSQEQYLSFPGSCFTRIERLHFNLEYDFVLSAVPQSILSARLSTRAPYYNMLARIFAGPSSDQFPNISGIAITKLPMRNKKWQNHHKRDQTTANRMTVFFFFTKWKRGMATGTLLREFASFFLRSRNRGMATAILPLCFKRKFPW